MTILRVVTDISVKEYPTAEMLKKVSDSVYTHVHGTLTSIEMFGDEKVHSRGSHVHESSEDEMCAYCRAHARDEIS